MDTQTNRGTEVIELDSHWAIVIRIDADLSFLAHLICDGQFVMLLQAIGEA